MTEHEEHVINVTAAIQATGMVVYNARIAVIRDPDEDVTKGGIIIPEEAKRKEPRGTVVAIGLGVEEGDMTGYAIGDRVMYTKYNPILFGIVMPDGEKVNLELMHVSDLYIGWRD